jgi:hypothetical protein
VEGVLAPGGELGGRPRAAGAGAGAAGAGREDWPSSADRGGGLSPEREGNPPNPVGPTLPKGLTNPGGVIIKVEPGATAMAPQVSPSTVSDCTRKAPLPVASHLPE